MRNRYFPRRDMARSRAMDRTSRDMHENYYVASAIPSHEHNAHMSGGARQHDYYGGDRRSDYSSYNDYRYNDYRYDYGKHSDSEKQYYEDIERWSEKLRRRDRFNIKKEDVISSAKQMGVRFEEFTEEEFYAVYLMMVSDYKSVSNDFRTYLNLAKEWLMDDDIEVSPSEKLCIYYYEIVKGEGLK